MSTFNEVNKNARRKRKQGIFVKNTALPMQVTHEVKRPVPSKRPPHQYKKPLPIIPSSLPIIPPPPVIPPLPLVPPPLLPVGLPLPVEEHHRRPSSPDVVVVDNEGDGWEEV